MLDRFYLIVDGVHWLSLLLPHGVKLVQLRIKNLGQAAVRKQVREARALCGQYGAQLIINDHWQVAIDSGCDFVHLGQEDLQGADLAAITAAGIRVGVSTHSEAELETALAMQPAYVALGPVYPTLLKQMPWAPQGLTRVRDWKTRVGQIPLVAIGGLTVERAEGVLAHGADHLAVVTDVSRNANPEFRVQQWLAATR